MKVKVSIVKCMTYDPKELQPAVTRAFDLIGGISSFIKKGERVLVKPNMLSGRPPEDGANTHVEVVRAVARLVKEHGAVPLIGDNPGGSISAKDAYESSGMLAVAREEGIECVESKGVRMVKGLPVSSYFFECDKIISLPKMKTHSLMIITGAIKNMFGAVSGLNKTECHKNFPKPEDFAQVLMDVFEGVRPHLALMDGIISMDKDGPASGRLRETGLLMASSDSVAIDSIFCHLIKVDPYSIPIVREAAKKGLGEIDLNNMEILGERIDDSYVDDFNVPGSRIMFNLPDFIVKALAGFIKFSPYVNESRCEKCKVCEKSCPISAITIGQGNARIDYKKCIRCMCCHEVCPYKAIELRRNILARLFGL